MSVENGVIAANMAAMILRKRCAICLLATPVLADVAGVASVIDGDTIEVHGSGGIEDFTPANRSSMVTI